MQIGPLAAMATAIIISKTRVIKIKTMKKIEASVSSVKYQEDAF